MSDEKLTPEQQVELAKAQAETARLAKETAEIEERSKKMDAQNRDLVMRDTIATGLASTGIRFHEPKDVFKLVTSEDGVEVHASADGRTLHCSKNGAEISFTALVEDYTLRHQFIADGRSLRHLKTDAQKVVCLDDIPDRADKIAFIAAATARGEDGEAAFARLPQHRPPKLADPSKMTARQWKELPVAERVRLCNVLSEEERSRIMQREEEKE